MNALQIALVVWFVLSPLLAVFVGRFIHLGSDR